MAEGENYMANFSHYTRGSCISITQHNERKKNAKGEYLKYKNSEIDTTRSHLNYNLAPDWGMTQLEFIRQRTEGLKCLKRKDVNVMASWLVTAPKTLPEERQREFFERSYKFLEQKYGKQNVISAYIHMDETTPHMHFCFVPVVYDRKKKREKVSCKECVTKYDLQKFHPEFQKDLDNWREQNGYEFECNILNGATAGGNLTVEQLKASELAVLNEQEQEYLQELVEMSNNECSTLQDIQNEIENLSQERTRLIEGISDLKVNKSTLEQQISILEGKLDVLKGDKQLFMEKFVNSSKIKPVFDKVYQQYLEQLEQQRTERMRSKTSSQQSSANMEYYRKATGQTRTTTENKPFSAEREL